MRKPQAGLFVCLIATMLVACASAGGSGDEPAAGGGAHGGSSAAPRTSETGAPMQTPAAASLDGVWVLRLDDPESSCILVHNRLVHITNGSATVSPHVAGLEDGDPELRGPATLDGTAVVLRVENPAPTKDSIDFSGTRGSDGTVTGMVTAGGIHPSMTNGYTCTFAANLVPVAAPGSADCTTEAVQAALNTAPGRTRFVTLQNQATQLVCSGDWALAFAQLDLDTGSPTLESDLLQVKGSAWEVHDFAAECASRDAPDDVLFACPVAG